MERIVLRTPGGSRLRVAVATTPRERTRGLLGRDRLVSDHALLIPGARSIHTVGMRFPILAAWLDDDGVVVRTRELAPGRIAWSAPGARHVLECAPSVELPDGSALDAVEGSAPWSDRHATAGYGNSSSTSPRTQ
ncbi:MAG: DUF192 domain-containing protein [Actinomycetota bacterium]